ncbi:hypothetical protein C8R47DRAFT_1170425 [Mycena vitilis]|nr:hypothetical protein C8R47DRAFT_1170425 [Mycena vitilis]
MAATDETPLLSLSDNPAKDLEHKDLFSPYRRILVATFLLSTTFAFTTTPLYWAYRIFNCQKYYEDPAHPPYEGNGDACAVTAVESQTAKDIAFQLTLTTLSATLNLIVTTWEIRNWGLRLAIIHQTFWPALRNLTQIYAISVGGRLGISILQGTQLISILGGGQGYLLSVNSYMAEVVEPEERTAAFGVLAGVAMLGTANGYVCGGLSNNISLSAPFKITFCLLVASTLFTAFCLPYIPPGGLATKKALGSLTPPPNAHPTQEGPKKDASPFAFLYCLRIFLPSRYSDGKGRFWNLGTPTLGVRCLLPLMLQLTATNEYGFKPSDNGFLIAGNALSRAVFLTLAFPGLIEYGRRWMSRHSSVQDSEAVSTEPSAEIHPHRSSAFDLEFLRYSMIVDAVLVALLVFSNNGGHIWAGALILPLASGTAPACKGVLLDMVPVSHKSDALSAIALVETTAMITAVSLYGALFAFLSDIGHPNFVYLFNALTALFSAFVLFAVRFPRGSLAEG